MKITFDVSSHDWLSRSYSSEEAIQAEDVLFVPEIWDEEGSVNRRR